MQGDKQMATRRSLITKAERDARKNATPGFAIKIEDDTELGMAILVAEFEGGTYQPIAVVVSINEAKEIAESNMRCRMRELERGGTPACPECYKVWVQGLGGEYVTAKEISSI
jgi:hypothetical protein